MLPSTEMAPQRLVIVGAGGFGREVFDVIEAINAEHSHRGHDVFTVLGFLDDGEPETALLDPYGVGHLGPVAHLSDLPEDVGYVIGIGDPRTRRRLDQHGGGRQCPVLVHPTATVVRRAELGAGTVVCSHASISNHVRLGRHVHVNLNCTIGHDAILDDYVTLSPQAAISGNVTLQECAFLGANSVVNQGLTIGREAVVGSGAAVVRDVADGVTVVGVPARPR